MQFKTAIYNSHYFKHLVGEGNIINERGEVSISNSPINGDDYYFNDPWNSPINVDNVYYGLSDPFVGKTRLEKLVAINEWMKEVLPTKYNQVVIDAYDFLVDKNRPAGDNRTGFNEFTLSNNQQVVTFDSTMSSDDYEFDIRINTEVLSQSSEVIKSGNDFIAIVIYSF